MAQETVGAGDVDIVRVEYTPTSSDRRFGVFQLYVRGVPLGDGSTTALQPHHNDLERLSVLAERPGRQRSQPLFLGDTFDHLELYLEITQTDVVLRCTTRPESEWGEPPSWAPEPGNWMHLSVPRSDFVAVWRAARPRFHKIMSCED